MGGQYRTIVADPPWDLQRLESPGRAGFGTQAGTLTIEEIAALPVGDLAEADAYVFIWTVNRYVEATYGIARADSTWWQWKRGAHSAKPDGFLDLVEQVSPGPYLELFARRARFGWDYWGNESLGTVELPVR